MDALVEQILQRRGYTDPHEQAAFLNPDYERHVHDPLQLADMREACARIASAIAAGERIVIYGDYDIDGLSATALLLDGLASMGAHVEGYIPDRFEEGYGLNAEALQSLAEAGASLVITVDCGSVSHEPLQWAYQAGLDVIVTDHHEVEDMLPPAVGIINPKRSDQEYPFPGLAGVGVAFKLIQGLQAGHGLLPRGQEKWLLDLVSLGTVCDVVPLIDENRVFVTFGMRVMARTPRIGLRALAREAGMSLPEVDTHHYGFVLGPRLNAAGRLEHARLSLEVLTTGDETAARTAARRLDALNSERRTRQDTITQEALEQAAALSDDPVLVLSHPEWDQGIVGIVAAKLVERLHKPAIVLQELGEEAKGSARSLGDFSIVEGLRAASQHLRRYGGHHVAAGCSLATADIPALREELRAYYHRGRFGDLRTTPEADADIEQLSQLDMETYTSLQQLAPFGMGNPRPLLRVPSVSARQIRAVGAQGQHLKATLSVGSHQLEAIGFHLYERYRELGGISQVWGELDVNTYNGRQQLQLRMRELS